MTPAPTFYYRHELSPPTDLQIEALGIDERMQPRLVHHVQMAGTYLLIHFHDPVRIGQEGATVCQPGETTILWRLDEPYVYGREDREWTHSWLLLGGPRTKELLTEFRLPIARPLQISARPIVRNCLRQLYDELHGFTPPNEQILESHIAVLARQIARAVRDPTEPPVRLDAVRRFIEANLHRPIALDELAGLAHLSVSRFSELFRQEFGQSPVHYVNELRIRRSTILLRDANLTVAQVSDRVGFADALYFSRKFKKRLGCSPTVYRRARYGAGG